VISPSSFAWNPLLSVPLIQCVPHYWAVGTLRPRFVYLSNWAFLMLLVLCTNGTLWDGPPPPLNLVSQRMLIAGAVSIIPLVLSSEKGWTKILIIGPHPHLCAVPGCNPNFTLGWVLLCNPFLTSVALVEQSGLRAKFMEDNPVFCARPVPRSVGQQDCSLLRKWKWDPLKFIGEIWRTTVLLVRTWVPLRDRSKKGPNSLFQARSLTCPVRANNLSPRWVPC